MLTYSQSKLYSSLWQKVSEAKGKKKAPLNKPFRTPGGSKKFGVYVKNEKGNVVMVRFGDPNMEIKRDDPNRRKNFRARHNCDNSGPKTKARYWSCKMWESGKSVTDYTKGSEEWDGVTFWKQDELLAMKPSLVSVEEIIETDECDCCFDDFEPETATSQLNRAIPGTKSDAKEVSEKSLKERNEEELARSFDSQAESITYSTRVIQSLKSKAKEHNAKSSKKVSLGQLKKVYRRGAESFSSSNRPGKSRGQWAMASVNTFLGMTGEGGDIIFDLRSSKASDALAPSEEDLTQADKDLAEAGLGLNIDFEVDELYIEEYETSSMLHVDKK